MLWTVIIFKTYYLANAKDGYNAWYRIRIDHVIRSMTKFKTFSYKVLANASFYMIKSILDRRLRI